MTQRRDFLKTALGVTGVALAGISVAQAAPLSGAGTLAGKNKFKLDYGPHLGMFENSAGKDPIDQLKFMADQGFTAFEDNGMMAATQRCRRKSARN